MWALTKTHQNGVISYCDTMTFSPTMRKRTHLNIFYAQFYPQFTKIIKKYQIFRSNGHEYFDWFAPQWAETFNTRLNTMDGQVSNEKTITKIKSHLKQIFCLSIYLFIQSKN